VTNQNSLEDTRNSGASSTALRTLRILKHLAAAPGPALVGEIATDLMEERNAVRRALQALLDFTDTTVTSPLKLFQIASNELDRGYGHCLDEWMEGVSCVGIAVKG